MAALLAVLVLAQGGENTAEAPDDGIGALLLIGAVVLVVLVAVGLWFVFTRGTRASRGGGGAEGGLGRRAPRRR